MGKNCLMCIYYDVCQDNIFPLDEEIVEESTCYNFIDFDFEIEYPENSDGEHYWTEMSFRRYNENKWDFEPSEWELFTSEVL